MVQELRRAQLFNNQLVRSPLIADFVALMLNEQCGPLKQTQDLPSSVLPSP